MMEEGRGLMDEMQEGRGTLFRRMCYKETCSMVLLTMLETATVKTLLLMVAIVGINR